MNRPPLGYMVGFFRLLARRPDLFNVCTYSNLPFGDDWDWRGNYPSEWATWQKARDLSRITVILHHDVDDRPDLTLAMLREEEAAGLRSTILLHERRVISAGPAGTAWGTYPVDDAAFLSYQDRGFEIGYHQNALEASGFDFNRGTETFRKDVASLRGRGFACHWTTAHGGFQGPAGEANNLLDIPPELERSLRWVANRHGIVTDRRFSDSDAGMVAFGSLDAAMCSWRPGERNSILVHPQYYPDVADSDADSWPCWKAAEEQLDSVREAGCL
jgi:hypothetical protein